MYDKVQKKSKVQLEKNQRKEKQIPQFKDEKLFINTKLIQCSYKYACKIQFISCKVFLSLTPTIPFANKHRIYYWKAHNREWNGKLKSDNAPADSEAITNGSKC